MQEGAYITEGPRDWQIFQQTGGSAAISIRGTKVNPQGKRGNVFVRVTEEDTGVPVIPWQQADAEDEGHWDICLRGVPAGGLYRIETCLKLAGETAVEWSLRGDMVHHAGVGDVFVIAGQSNSAGYGKDFIYDPPEPGVHLFRNNMNWDMASHPFNDSTRTAHEVNSEAANSGNSPYLAFARRLKKALGYPIGLIQASLGGSPLSQWNPEEDGSLYRSMLKTIAAAGNVKGVLWYQGCSDAAPLLADTYLERFTAMVSRLRSDLANPGLVFLTVQLNRYTAPETGKTGEYWNTVREAQRLAALTVENVFVVPSTDLGLSDAIHISAAGNMVLGERIAAAALLCLYKKPFGYAAPDIKAVVKTAPDTVEMHFAPVLDRLYAYDAAPAQVPFDFQDEKGPLEPESYAVSKNVISFRFNRAFEGSAWANGLSGQNPRGIPPVDFATHAPVLAFNRFPAEVLPNPPGAEGYSIETWEGFRMDTFNLKGILSGKSCKTMIVYPAKPAPGRPWVWRAEFFGAFPWADLALLRAGWHVAYCSLSDLYGAPQAVEGMKNFHSLITGTWGLSGKPAIFGFSRGGLYAVNYAYRYPGDISCLYLDAPVLDIRSWPGGFNRYPRSGPEWEQCKEAYGLTDESAASFSDSPLNRAPFLAEKGIP
ncbi:MAG: hypothetical protein LBC62_05615, partial [Treponema sp.]|nr:hypothetical protein [Treponema sp.]